MSDDGGRAEEEEEEDEKADGEARPAPGGPSRRPEKDALKVFVGGLAYETPKFKVRAHLEEACGEIDWLHIPRDDQGRSRGIAFASFWSAESLQKALELDGTEFEGRTLKVNMSTDKPANGAAPARNANMAMDKLAKGVAPASEDVTKRKAADPAMQKEEKQKEKQKQWADPSKEREVFIGSIPFDCKEEVLRKDFSECGKIEKMTLLHGVAFISYATVEGVEKALKYNGTKYGKCTLVVRLSSEKREPKAAEAAPAGAAKAKKKAKKNGRKRESGTDQRPKEFEVIIKGLPFATKEASLKEMLAECGDIESVRMPVNKRGRGLGFVFVAFQEKKGLKRALKLNGSDLGGGTVVVEQTVEKEAPVDADAPAQKKARKAAPEADPAEAAAPPKKKARKVAPEADAAEAADDAADMSAKAKAREEKRRRMEGFSKEDIIARTKANREKAKANRKEYKKAKAAAGGGDT